MRRAGWIPSVVAVGLVIACGQDGAQGPPGPPGAVGGDGTNGEGGTVGANGEGGAGQIGKPGDPIAADPLPTSGTRIKARRTTTTTTTADGAKSVTSYFGGWFDSQRNEPCASGVAADGKSRCLPTAVPLQSIYFSDAACTSAIVFVSSASPAGCASGGGAAAVPKYVSTSATISAGCVGTKISAIGAKNPLATYYIKSGASCIAEPATSGLDYYDANGAEVSATDFEEFQTTTSTL